MTKLFHVMQASDEVDSKGPRGFFQPLLGGWHSLKAYPTLITTQMSGHRAGDALTYLSVSFPAASCTYARWQAGSTGKHTDLLRHQKRPRAFVHLLTVCSSCVWRLQPASAALRPAS